MCGAERRPLLMYISSSKSYSIREWGACYLHVIEFSLSNNYTVFVENHNLWRFDCTQWCKVSRYKSKVDMFWYLRGFLSPLVNKKHKAYQHYQRPSQMSSIIITLRRSYSKGRFPNCQSWSFITVCGQF